MRLNFFLGAPPLKGGKGGVRRAHSNRPGNTTMNTRDKRAKKRQKTVAAPGKSKRK